MLIWFNSCLLTQACAENCRLFLAGRICACCAMFICTGMLSGSALVSFRPPFDLSACSDWVLVRTMCLDLNIVRAAGSRLDAGDGRVLCVCSGTLRGAVGNAARQTDQHRNRAVLRLGSQRGHCSSPANPGASRPEVMVKDMDVLRSRAGG